jgi:hypothetical protein
MVTVVETMAPSGSASFEKFVTFAATRTAFS